MKRSIDDEPYNLNSKQEEEDYLNYKKVCKKSALESHHKDESSRPRPSALTSNQDQDTLYSEEGEVMGRRGKRNSRNNKIEFHIHSKNRNSTNQVQYRQPVEFGSFCTDIKRQFCDDNRFLRKYCKPNANDFQFDLKIGYNTFVRKNEDINEHLDTLLMWLEKHGDRLHPSAVANRSNSTFKENRFNTDFIAWRGLFTKIFCTPYEKRDPWQFAAIKVHGTIFMCEIETAFKRNERLNRSAKLDQMCYWGFKFEDYVTKEQDGKVGPHDIINNCESYCSVVRSRLGNHSIVIGAEVDCKDDSDAKSPQNYIELKTTRHMTTSKQWENFVRYKLKKFWAQSFLCGLPTIICGLRDDNGIVDELKTFKTMEIPSLTKRYHGCWDANNCIQFADRFLNFVKGLAVDNNPDIIYNFYFNEPFQTIEVKVKEGIKNEKFLPEWFLNL